MAQTTLLLTSRSDRRVYVIGHSSVMSGRVPPSLLTFAHRAAAFCCVFLKWDF